MRAFLLSLLVSTVLPAQSVAELVDTLAKASTLDDEAVGDGGEKTATYRAYESLRAAADAAGLSALLEHRSPIVRCYAARALAERKETVDWLAVLKAHALDVAPVTTFRGCVRAEEACGDVLVELVRERKLLADALWTALAEHLVLQKSPLRARDHELRERTLGPALHAPLRELAAGGDGSAAVALARYRDAADVPVLQKLLAGGGEDDGPFVAAAVFPGPVLREALCSRSDWFHQRLAKGAPAPLRAWLAALAAQQDAPAGAALAAFVRQVAEHEPDHLREVLLHTKAALVPFSGCAALEPVRDVLRGLARR